MKRSIFVNLLVVVVLSGVMLAPAARPFIDPRATIRTIVTCHGPVTGIVLLTDSQGRTFIQMCRDGLRTTLAYSGQHPAPEAPWLVAVTARPAYILAGLPRTCQSEMTSLPGHLTCAAAGAAPLSVDFDLILTYDSGSL